MRLPSYFKSVFTFIFAIYALMAASYVLPSMLLARGVPAWQTGLIVSAFFIGATPGRLLGSIMVERLGIKRTILVFSLIGMAASLMYPFASFSLLMVSRVIVGACYSTVYVAVTTYQGFVISEEDRGRMYGYFCVASISPQFVIVPLSEFLIDMGAETAYLLLSAFILALMAFYALRLKIVQTNTAKSEEKQEWGTWGELLSRRDTWSLLSCTIMLCLTGTACVQYTPNLMRLMGYKGSFYTWSLTAVSVVVRLFCCGTLLAKFDRRTAFCAWALVEAVSLMCSAASASVPAFVMSGILFGLSHGFNYPILSALVPDVIPKHLLPKGIAIYLLTNDLPPILMPLMMGFVPASIGLAGVMMTVGVLCLVMTPLVYLFLWRCPPLFARTRRI